MKFYVEDKSRFHPTIVRVRPVRADDITDEMAERAARALYYAGMGYDIDADPTARAGMLTVAREALVAAFNQGGQSGG